MLFRWGGKGIMIPILDMLSFNVPELSGGQLVSMMALIFVDGLSGPVFLPVPLFPNVVGWVDGV